MSEIDTTPILDGLNDRQKEAVLTTDGPLLVIAGPGSGKTRVLTSRIAWLLAAQKAAPYQVLALTFTNKAAEEMNHRVKNLIPTAMTNKMWIGTFHALMARLLRIEAKHIGFTSDFTIYDTDDADRQIKLLITEHDYDPKKIKPRAVRSYISLAKNKRMTSDQMKLDAKSRNAEIAAKLYDPYSEALKTSNALDFDDLLLKPLDLFAQNPDVLAKYQQKWSYIMIDEYQDTNHVQYMLAKSLSGMHRNLCVVGDDAQSIYSFRGADISNIFSFEKDFSEATVVRLEENYRSTSAILNLADSVISNNKQRIEKTLWTANEIGKPVSLIDSHNDRDEAQRTVRLIREEMPRGSFRHKDFAILYRTNAQSRVFEEALRQAGVPYQIIGGISFYQRREIKDAIAYLRLLVNPDDLSSFQRVINYPGRGIGAKSVQNIIEFIRQGSFTLSDGLKQIESLPILKRAQNSLQKFVTMIDDHSRRVELGHNPSKIANSLFHESGMFDDLESDETLVGQGRIENLRELLNGLEKYINENESASLSSFLQDISLLTDADDKSTSDQVTLMTLHASKGLEFSVVFIVGLEEGVLPLIREEKISPLQLEEERRLFYVGITRAKKRLFLSWAKLRYRYGGKVEYNQPSRFVDEVTSKNIKTRRSAFKTPTVSRSTNQAPSRPDRHQSKLGPSTIENFRSKHPKQSASKISGSKVINTHTSQFKKGTKVRHKTYGIGIIMNVEGKGTSTTVTILFEKFGNRMMRVAFAPLQVIDN